MGYFLPQKYKELHDLCFYLHDILVQVVKEGENKKLFHTKYKLKKRSDIKTNELPRSKLRGINTKISIRNRSKLRGIKPQAIRSNINILEWLCNNGYEDEFKSIVIKQVLIATISDYCHYVYEALKCSEKSKLAITYTLLRKPLKDNLLFFEWIITNRNEFIEKFQKNSNYYAIDKIDSTKKKMFIGCSVNQINYSETFNADFIYNIRYSKKTDYSLERLWNVANHLVTTCKYYKTEDLNLNFVFSGADSQESQWNYLYSVLPYLLFYTVEVIQVVLDQEIGENKFDILLDTFEERAKIFEKTVQKNFYNYK